MTSRAIFISLMALIPLAIAFFVCFKQRREWGLLHIYLVMVSLSYGAYTIVDAAVVPSDDIDPLGAALLMLSIGASMIVLVYLFSQLAPAVRHRASLEYLVQTVQRVPPIYVAIPWSLVVMWRVFVYLQYGLIANADTETLALFSVFVPFWVGPVNQLAIAFTFTVFIWLIASLSGKKSWRASLPRIAMLVLTIALLSLQGRRVFLNMLVVGTMTFVVARKKTDAFFSVRNMIVGAFALAAVGLFSNFYQSIRGIYLVDAYVAGDIASNVDFNLTDAVLNFQNTTENLERRVALWRFHYWIMEGQLEDPGKIMGGQILWSGIAGVIPRVLIPDKVVIGDDILACRFYAKQCPGASDPNGVDYAQTIQSGLQADFGFLFILLVPCSILAVLLMVAHYGRVWQEQVVGRILYVLVFGATAEFLVNVEQNVGNLFSLARDIALITLIIGAVEFVLRSDLRRIA